MKKYFQTLLTAATLLTAVSCSPIDELFSGEDGEAEKVSFTISTGQIQGRSAGDGNTVDQVHYEVWDKATGSLVISSVSGRNGGSPVPVVDGRAYVSVKLVKGVEYDISFWAHNEQGTAYQISDGLEHIRIKTDIKANKEAYDAFYHTLMGYKVSQGVTDVILKRPFAQVNVGTTLEDWQKALNLDVEIDRSTVSVTGIPNVFNAHTGGATREEGVASLTYDLNDVLKETFDVDGMAYQYLGMNYVLAGTDKTLHELSIVLYDDDTRINELKVINMPVQRNWRTNIVGSLLTDKEKFRIVIEPEFEGDHNKEIETENY
ncbi:MAG: hypothetical protein IJB61_04080 [Bacteroides sp]|nr:hypothetical protein [Bacteroides sp.]